MCFPPCQNGKCIDPVRSICECDAGWAGAQCTKKVELLKHTVNHDIHVALNSCGFIIKNDSWKSSVIYFMRICNTGV